MVKYEKLSHRPVAAHAGAILVYYRMVYAIH